MIPLQGFIALDRLTIWNNVSTKMRLRPKTNRGNEMRCLDAHSCENFIRLNPRSKAHEEDDICGGRRIE